MLASGDLDNFNTYITGTVDLALVKTNDTGKTAWTKRYIAAASKFDRPNAVAIKKTASGYFLAGNYYAATLADWGFGFVIKTDKAGNILWSKKLGAVTPSNVRNEINNVMEMDGSLFLTMSSTAKNDMLLIKLDSSGAAGSCSFVDTLTVEATKSPDFDNSLSVINAIEGNPLTANPSVSLPRTVRDTIFCATCCPATLGLSAGHSNRFYCVGDLLTFSTSINGAINPGGGFSYQWYYNTDGGAWLTLPSASGGNGPGPNLYATTPGPYNMKLVLGSLNGFCRDSAFLSVFVGHIDSATLTTTACDSLVFHGSLYSVSGNYRQVISGFTGCDSIVRLDLTINHTGSSALAVDTCFEYTLNGQRYTSAGTYTQHLKTAGGCDSTLTLTLRLNGKNGIPCDSGSIANCCCFAGLTIPNGITPNNDGINDVWSIKNTAICRKISVRIYNRWGNVVYRDDNYSNNWGGTNQSGDKLPQGTYFAVIRLDDDTESSLYLDLRY
jgi:gliding motility-associated-like protein